MRHLLLFVVFCLLTFEFTIGENAQSARSRQKLLKGFYGKRATDAKSRQVLLKGFYGKRGNDATSRQVLLKGFYGKREDGKRYSADDRQMLLRQLGKRGDDFWSKVRGMKGKRLNSYWHKLRGMNG